MRPSDQNSLYKNIFDLDHQFINCLIALQLSNNFHGFKQRLFKVSFILLKFFTFFIDGIVGQVHEQIVVICIFAVLVSRKSGQTIMVQEALEFWDNLSHKDIQSKIKFLFFNQVRKSFVLLNHMAPLVPRNILNFPC